MKAIIISLLSIFIATGVQAQGYYTNGALLDGGDSVRFTCTVEQSRGQTYVTLRTGKADDYMPQKSEGYYDGYSVSFQWNLFKPIVAKAFTLEQLDGIPETPLIINVIGNRKGTIVYMEAWFALNAWTNRIPPSTWGDLFRTLQREVKFLFADSTNNQLIPEAPEESYYRLGGQIELIFYLDKIAQILKNNESVGN